MSALVAIAYFAVVLYAWPWFAVALIREDDLMRGDKAWELFAVGSALFIALFWPVSLLILWQRRRVMRLVGRQEASDEDRPHVP